MARRNYQLTQGDYAKISEKSRKNGYGFSRAQMITMAKRHFNGNDKTKAIIEEQLDDVNYHSEADFLRNDNYKGFEREVNKNYGTPKARPQVFADIERSNRRIKAQAYRAQRKAMGKVGG